MGVPEGLFWLALLGAIYSYFLYPLLLAAFARGGGAPPSDPPEWPRLSLIIAAYNEERRIAEKIENSLALDYPQERLQIIVASDGSSDGTDQIVRGFAQRGVHLVRPPQRQGKEHAQACALREAGGEILVFSDAATTIAPGSLKAIARRLTQAGVGAVSSEDRFVSADGRLAGEGAYVRYEMWLRRLESRGAGLIGLSGSFFAARREVCRDWRSDIPSDFNTALNCARLGLKAVADAEVIGIYPDIRESGQEYRRKLRTVIRGMAALAAGRELLHPRYRLFAFQVWSHKLLRWAVPFCLLGLLAASLPLSAQGGFYEAALWAQAGFYAVAGAGLAWAPLRRSGPVRLAAFFLQVNAAILHAAIAFIGGRRITLWEPSRR